MSINVQGQRQIVLYELMSLDGFADDPGEGEWFGDADGRLADFLGATIATQDTVLLGRTTYEKWAPYWPTSTMQPFADFINGVDKRIFTSSPLALEWARSSQVRDALVPYATALKAEAGSDIGVHGSLSIARALLAAELVDQLRLVVAPSLAGGGKPLLDGTAGLQRFSLISAERSGGCLLLHYRR